LLNLGVGVEHIPGRLVAKAITPDQECIDVLGQFQQAAALGELAVGYLRRGATTDKGKDYEGSAMKPAIIAVCVSLLRAMGAAQAGA
jgi:hypothetical protein